MISKKYDSNIGIGFCGLAYQLGADYETPTTYGFDDDPWVGVDELTYEEALELLQRYFHVSNFQAIEY